MRRADEEMLDKILVLQTRATQSASTAPLLSISRDRSALDVTRMGDGDDHILFGDQILDRELAFVAGDLGSALVAVLVGDRLELVADDFHAPWLRGEDLAHVVDEASHAPEFLFELRDLETR